MSIYGIFGAGFYFIAGVLLAFVIFCGVLAVAMGYLINRDK